MPNAFSFTAMPNLFFGAGQIGRLGEHAASFGRSVLLVTGAESFRRSGHFEKAVAGLKSQGLAVDHYGVEGEPSPEIVDSAVAAFSAKIPEVVVAIGGGSVLDAGKAIAAMLMEGGPVIDFLEGVGSRQPSGRTLPLIAVPTTAGTGSEATKNAVISQIGKDGFKKSLRHDGYIPRIAIVDPELGLSAPSRITAACGMDALSQLIESFLSTKASRLTDALAVDGLRCMLPALPRACGSRADDPEVRGAVAYAAFLSGVTLAHAGLGVVHGIAGPMGGTITIPHGMACANLLPGAMAATLENLKQTADSANTRMAMDKFAGLGRWFGGRYRDPLDCCAFFIDSLYDWLDRFAIPTLGNFGLTEEHIEGLAGLASNKNNPVALSDDQIRRIIRERF